MAFTLRVAMLLPTVQTEMQRVQSLAHNKEHCAVSLEIDGACEASIMVYPAHDPHGQPPLTPGIMLLQVVKNLLQHLLPLVHTEDLDLYGGEYADDKVSYEVCIACRLRKKGTDSGEAKVCRL